MSHSNEFIRLVQEAKRHIQEIDITQLKVLQESKTDFYLIDVREDGEWAQGYIPGAIHIGKGVIERDIESVIPDKEASLVLYCGGGYRSALAAESLQKMGYQQVISLDGGYKAWCLSQ